ncbi:MAG: hypothetical protein C4287_23205 [Leptolyngbya sp. ERB_1_2]
MYDLAFSHNLLRLRRREAKLTSAAMADQLGISRQAYSRIECGVGNPSAVTLAKICLILNSPVESFFHIKMKNPAKAVDTETPVV